ncbi:unnamed protein product [Calypogeia fissa]
MGKQIITRLSPAVVSQLRSTTILSNVAQIAEELVCNSLDAGATKIEIAVDGEACHMKVDDDGCGISREDLTLVGERHATSKLHSLDELEGGVATLGFRGEALSSLSDVSLVEITSRCRGMPNTYRKILKGGTTLSIGLSGEQRTYGTTVVVRDMFYNQPVRRRLLNSSQRKILQSVKECIMRYVLIHPQVSFTVKDLARRDILLHTTSAATLTTTLCNMFGADVFSKLQEIDYGQDSLRLTGFLSKDYHSHSSKALQYFYINRRYVLKTALHKLINSYGGKSKDSMGRFNSGEQGARGQVPSGRHLRPAFVLNLTCPFSDYDITFEAAKTLVEFKDWEPVVSFVRNIILKMWGDQSVGNRQGYCQAPGSIAADHVKTPSSNGNSNHSKTFKLQNGSKDEIPPMAVRRALVQIDSPHPRDFNKDCISKPLAAAPSDHTPEQLRTASQSLVLSCPSRKQIASMETFSRMHSIDESMAKETQILPTDFPIDDSCAASPKPLWRMTQCRQHLSPDQPAILDSHWFSSSTLSPDSAVQNLLHSGDSQIAFLFCNGGTSASTPEKCHYSRSSHASKRFLRSSSSPTDAWKSPPERFMEKSTNTGRDVKFRGDDDERCWSPAKGSQKALFEKWWDSENTLPKTPIRSPSNDSIGIPRILNTSNFLPAVSICSPERTSDDGHPSYELKWSEFDSDHSENVLLSNDSLGIPRILNTSDFIPEVSICSPERTSDGGRLSYELKWSEFDSDHSVDEIDWRSRIQIKRQRADYASDNDELTDFFSAKSFSFSPESEEHLGNVEINKSNSVSWNFDTKDSDGTETAFQESIGYRIISPTGQEHGDDRQDEGNDFKTDSYNPRSKRRLDLELDPSCDILKLHSEHCEKQKPGGKQGKVHDSSTSEIKRGTSGPPFYRPPKRQGLHINPPKSLSTVEKMRNIAEDGVPTPMEPDTGSKIAVEGICGTNQKRDMPQKRIECTVQPGERGVDCDGKSTKATPIVDQEEFEQEIETFDTSKVDRPSNRGKSLQQMAEVDVHEHCKYRSTDVNNDGENLPVDTVKAMFKEWSNPCMKKDDDILDLSYGILASNVSSLIPESITKDVFKQARVLQQVDTKFIASISCGVLLLIDQHAADERVRLEELRDDVLGGNITKQISLLGSSQQLTMTFTEQQTLQAYSQQIQDWGWRFKIVAEKEPTTSHEKLWPSTGGTCKVLLSAVPSILGVTLSGADLVEYLQQLTDTQGSSTPPPAVIRLLNYKACRGAIMFGDKLLPSECNQLVDHLKKTHLCFQCAHGRPTMVPLVDFQALHRRFGTTFGSSRPGAKIDSDARKTHPSRRGWHGLQSDCKPTLARAKTRLAQAQGV